MQKLMIDSQIQQITLGLCSKKELWLLGNYPQFVIRSSARFDGSPLETNSWPAIKFSDRKVFCCARFTQRAVIRWKMDVRRLLNCRLWSSECETNMVLNGKTCVMKFIKYAAVFLIFKNGSPNMYKHLIHHNYITSDLGLFAQALGMRIN